MYSAQIHSLTPQIIDVEIDLSRGPYSFSMVGLPSKGVEESQDRVFSAIRNSGFQSPKNRNYKTVFFLAPADLKKEGAFFDLALALGYLLSAGDIRFNPHQVVFLGELSLDGEVRPIKGALPLTLHAKQAGFKTLFVPKQNAEESAVVEGINIFPVQTLREAIDHLNTKEPNQNEKEAIPYYKDFDTRERKKIEKQKRTVFKHKPLAPPVCFSDVYGQETAKRGLEIAAAGRHNIALYGPPGTGKTMLAQALCGILPELSFEEALHVTSIHSSAGLLDKNLLSTAPFRAPHHTASYVSIVGGGTYVVPGEITLAHYGVLFLDEFPEFDRRVIEALRQPLEEKTISISRSKNRAIFPADFILIVALNPCPCGNYGNHKCTCSPKDISRYKRKISGPIIDRIDMWIELPKISPTVLSRKGTGGETSGQIRERIKGVRTIQNQRLRTFRQKGKRKAEEKRWLVDSLSSTVREILNTSTERLSLSPRVYHQQVCLARTIADLEGKNEIETSHILEALQYRPKDSDFYSR